ncbi:MAG TPA: hypothetical protein VF221_13660 [Chloroflexota bacterium]
MYREIQEIQPVMETVQSHLREALLAGNTRDMIERSDQAQAAAAVAKEQMDRLLGSGQAAVPSTFIEPKTEVRFLDASNRALSMALEEAEKVALGTDVDGMRARVIGFKTRTDFADAYLRATLGTEGTS